MTTPTEIPVLCFHCNKGKKKDEAILSVLRRYVMESRNILFEGNGYSDEWVKEAAKRGLSNIKTTPHCLDVYLRKESIKLFADLDVMSAHELEARTEIYQENYKMKIQIESRVMGDLCMNHIIPAAISYQNKVIETLKNLKEVYAGEDFKRLAAPHDKIIKEISERIAKVQELVHDMIEERKKANVLEEEREAAMWYCEKVIPYMSDIRYQVDKLELVVEDDLWPLPKYREMLFSR